MTSFCMCILVVLPLLQHDYSFTWNFTVNFVAASFFFIVPFSHSYEWCNSSGFVNSN